MRSFRQARFGTGRLNAGICFFNVIDHGDRFIFNVSAARALTGSCARLYAGGFLNNGPLGNIMVKCFLCDLVTEVADNILTACLKAICKYDLLRGYHRIFNGYPAHIIVLIYTAVLAVADCDNVSCLYLKG